MFSDYQFGEEFQKKLLAFYLRKPQQAEGLIEASYFTNPIHAEIARLVSQLRDRNKEIPLSRHTLYEIVRGVLGRRRADLWPAFRKTIRSTWKESLEESPILREKALEFARERLWREALVESEKDVNLGHYENALRRFDKIRSVGVEKNLGIDYWEDPTNPNRWEQDRTGQIGTHYLPKLDRMMRGGVGAGELAIVLGKGKAGKAQPLWCKIKTPTGWKRMGELQVGDDLASVDGKPSKVLGIFPQGFLRVYKITFSDGRSTFCSGNHLWMVSSSNGFHKELRIMKTKWLLKRVYSTTAHGKRRRGNPFDIGIPTCNGKFGSDKKLPIHPYLLGLLLGDGTFYKTPRITTTFDKEILEEARRIVLSEGRGYNCFRTGSKKGFSFRISIGKAGQGADVGPNYYGRQLTKMGLLHQDGFNKFIPNQYLRSSQGDRIALLQGLMDTNGGAGKGKGDSAVFSTVGKQLGADFQKLVWSLGGVCKSGKPRRSYYTYKGKKKLGAINYHFSVCMKNRTWMFRLSRKLIRISREHKHTAHLGIADIKYQGKEQCQCIVVSHPSQLYITDNYIVTHNSTFLGMVARGALWCPGEKTVALATGELSANKYRKRLDASITGYSGENLTRFARAMGRDRRKLPRELRHHLEKALHKMGAMHSQMKGRLFIREWPTNKGKIRDIERWLDEIEQERGSKVDLLIVDYIRVFKPNDRYEEHRMNIGQTTLDLRGVAVERGIPVWTAQQSRRASYDKDVLNPSDIAEDISQFWTLDFLIAFCQTPKEEAKGTPPDKRLPLGKKPKPQEARVYLLSARDTVSGGMIPVKIWRDTFEIRPRDRREV